jgi:aromatic ring-opening dioxygenase LigB subunit
VKVTHDVVRQYKGKTNIVGVATRSAFIHEHDGSVLFAPHPEHYDRYDADALTADDMETLRDQLHEQLYM